MTNPMYAVNPAAATNTLDPPVGAQIDYRYFMNCVHCGLCTSACPTYLETGNENDSPRGRIYLMRGVVDRRLELTDSVKHHLELCLDCRSCETACPSGVQYGRLIEPFRVEMQQRELAAGATSNDWFRKYILYGLFPFAHRLRWALAPVRWAQRLGLDQLAEGLGLTKLLPKPLQRMHALLPKLSSATPPLPALLSPVGKRRARVALFTGCVADAIFGHTNWATARVLQFNGCEVVVPRGQVCCGAIHYHSGAGEPALKLAQQNAAAFNIDDVDAVIVNVAGCGSMLKDYGHVAHEISPADDATRHRLDTFARKVKDVSEFLASLGPVRPTGEIKLRATYHDACHLCHAQKIREQPRELLSLVPGLELVPLAESEICCGAAGSYNLTQPEMAAQLGQRKLHNILKSNAQAVITANAGCSLQLQMQLRQAGYNLWVAHPMDVLDLSYRQQLPRKFV